MFLTLDGGTTNTRAVLIAAGRPLAISTRPVGARDVAGGTTNPVAQAAAECIGEALAAADMSLDDVRFIAASGMLTSNVGLIDLPHVPAPAGVAELSAAVHRAEMPEICPRPIHFVRGVKRLALDDSLSPPGDMMRGEECETLGLATLLETPGPAQFVLPGSHTKWVRIDAQGRIERFRTALTGEMIAALADHTVLRASLPDSLPQSPDMEWARKGCRWAKACGLLHSAFGVRLAHVLAESTPEQRAALLVGIVVGADAAESVRTGAVEPAAPIWIAGASPLREVYRLAISENLSDDSKVRCVDDAVARIAPALGAIQVVAHFLGLDI